MNQFTIDIAAKLEIERIFKGSGYIKPVAKLYERSENISLLDDLASDLVSGCYSSDTIGELARERFQYAEAQIKSLLAIGVEESSQFSQEYLTTIGDITFLMTSDVVAKLGGYTLVFKHDRFVLVSADGTPYTLRSIWI